MVKPFLRPGEKTFKIRPRVPLKYLDVAGATHVTRSLQTRCPVEAGRRVHTAMAELYREWEEKLRAAQPPFVTRDGTRQIWDATEAARWVAEVHLTVLRHELDVLRPQLRRDPLIFGINDSKRYLEMVAHDGPQGAIEAMLLDHARSRPLVGWADISWTEETWSDLRRAVHEIFVPCDATSDQEFLTLVRSTLRSGLDDLAAFTCDLDCAQRALGKRSKLTTSLYFGRALTAPERPPQPSHAPRATGVPAITDYANTYIAERGAGLSNERREILRAVLRELADTVGDKAVTDLTKADVTAFKAVLLSLPPNWVKNRELRSLTVTEAARRAQEQGLSRQSDKSIRKKWSIARTVFRHVAANFDAKLADPFPADALALSDAPRRSATDQWSHFEEQELKLLLSSNLPEPLRWMTWIGLYAGLRLNEICQLEGRHIRNLDGVPFIQLTGAMRLKSAACVRSIPVHSALAALGFLDFAKEAKDGPLFPDLTQRDTTGRFSDAQSKAFSRHLRDVGLKRPRLSFHSLRHSWKAAWDRVHPQATETRERLLGHVIEGVRGRYGASYEAESRDFALLRSRAALLEAVRFAPRDAQQEGPEADDVAA